MKIFTALDACRNVYLSAGNAACTINNECVPDKKSETANILFSADMFQTCTFDAHLEEVLSRLYTIGLHTLLLKKSGCEYS